ncbi:MAG: hypothetical protein BAA01_05755 [Bacillus thermozeamaize]|uniref:Helicase ATP-binding domain-containing protein n=1 Tax=Bacillus thermozeamaize TaxID=230954 RepID=A0A1Y3PBC6_9BACI|nr:MAG: hypothetical protein BAA01_05755 [Bacillus thermozeamaize]
MMFPDDESRDQERVPLDEPDMAAYEELIEAVFAPDGLLAKRIHGYEVRQDQVRLARRVMASLKLEHHLLAEAGTGIGKSFAYLVAAALWALLEKKVVVISTHTIPLQSQLVDKDLPLVAEVMSELGMGELRFELAKGRGNYLCKRRLEAYLLKARSEEVEHADVARQMWQLKDQLTDGDRPSFPFPIPSDLWTLVAGEADDCHGSESPYFDHCFIQQARRRLSSAHLIITNHAMFFTDLAMRQQEGSGIFPEYDHVIFDEAHRIEEVFSSFFARRVNYQQVEHLFRMIRMRWQTWMDGIFDQEVLEALIPYEQRIRQHLLDMLDQVARQVFLLQPGGARLEAQEADQPLTVLLDRPLPVFQRLEESLADLERFFRQLLETKVQEETQRRGMERLIQRVRSLGEDIRFITQVEGGADWAHWVEWRLEAGEQISDAFGQQITLVAQPINARTVLPDALFSRVPVSMLSATLSTEGHFAFIAGRLGLDEYDSFVAPSPFDYARNALLVVSEKAPFPNQPDGQYERFLVEGLQRILTLSPGRTLVLFTSYRQMSLVAEQLKAWCEARQRTLLVQEAGGDRERLLEQFRKDPHGVLFGAESFWEGIDLPGDELQCVVITKIPFANPKHPVTRARLDWIERSGGDSFDQYMIPMAIIKTKQGFGRLIRRACDRGAVVLMDSRLVRKGYGKRILSSLPPARRGKLKDIPHYVRPPQTATE